MPGSDGRCPRFPSDSFSRYGFLAGTLGGKAVYGCDFRLLAPAGSTDKPSGPYWRLPRRMPDK